MHRRPGVDLGLWWKLSRLIRRERIEAVHTHNVTPWVYAALGARLAGARLYHTEHSNLFPHQRRLMAAERWLARLTRVVIADSEKVKRQLVTGQGLPARKIRTVLNGIDLSAFAAPASPQAIRQQLGLNGAAPVIGTVGRLAAVKDQRSLLDAFHLVAQEFPLARLVLVGDGPLKEELRAHARALAIDARVDFLGRRTDVSALLGVFDVFVLSSVSEGLPLTVLEAMASGVPVVATDVGALPEIIRGPEEGVLVPPKAPRQLAQAIARLLRDAPLRQTLSRNGRARVREQFDLNDMVRAYESAYRH
jgi:glycosyltransferase involved in cell wall biosynthesis